MILIHFLKFTVQNKQYNKTSLLSSLYVSSSTILNNDVSINSKLNVSFQVFLVVCPLKMFKFKINSSILGKSFS